MPIPTPPSYDHGSTGTQPPQARDYINGDSLDADELDYYLNVEFTKIKQIIEALNEIDSGQITVGNATDAANVTGTYKGNDIDTDGDGIVDEAIRAQAAEGVFNLASDIADASGNTVYDGSNNHVPESRVEQGGGSGFDADTTDNFHGNEMKNSKVPLWTPSGDLKYKSASSDDQTYNTSFSAPNNSWTDSGARWTPDWADVYMAQHRVNYTVSNFNNVSSGDDVETRLIDSSGNVPVHWTDGHTGGTGTESRTDDVANLTAGVTYRIEFQPINSGCDIDLHWIDKRDNETVDNYIQ